MRHAFHGILLAHAFLIFGGASAQVPGLAVPVDPVEAVVAAFDTHDLVALTTHGHEEDGAFWRALLNEPQFRAAVDDIVVEFGTARYQDVMDRFTSGESVPYAELEKAWQQTTQPHHVSDAAMYEEFFRGVREVNAALPKEDRLRVVLAEPPIDWSTIEDFEDLLPWLQRRFSYEAEVVDREVLTKSRKALLLAASGHYLEETPVLKAIRARGQSVFKVWSTNREDLAVLQPNVVAWPRPSLARVAGTILGAAPIDTFYGLANSPPGPFERQFDAILYLGPASELTEARIAPELCSDREYLAMRLPRLNMAAQAGAPDWLEEFSAYCAGVTSR